MPDCPCTNEQFVEDLRAENRAEEESGLQSPFLTSANPSTSIGATRRGVMTRPRHSYHRAILDVADEIWVRVAGCNTVCKRISDGI